MVGNVPVEQIGWSGLDTGLAEITLVIHLERLIMSHEALYAVGSQASLTLCQGREKCLDPLSE